MRAFQFVKFLDNDSATTKKKNMNTHYIGPLHSRIYQTMHDGQIAQHRLQDQMMAYFTDTQTSQRTIIDKYQHMHFFTFNTVLVSNVDFKVKIQ